VPIMNGALPTEAQEESGSDDPGSVRARVGPEDLLLALGPGVARTALGQPAAYHVAHRQVGHVAPGRVRPEALVDDHRGDQHPQDGKHLDDQLRGLEGSLGLGARDVLFFAPCGRRPDVVRCPGGHMQPLSLRRVLRGAR
jgi:hypothetical protein